jgi:hypothetical protein
MAFLGEELHVLIVGVALHGVPAKGTTLTPLLLRGIGQLRIIDCILGDTYSMFIVLIASPRTAAACYCRRLRRESWQPCMEGLRAFPWGNARIPFQRRISAIQGMDSATGSFRQVADDTNVVVSTVLHPAIANDDWVHGLDAR